MHTMRQLQTTLSDENTNFIMMGDINIDLLKFSTHNKTNEYLDNTFSQGYIPIITKPTRVTQYSATLIDHIYINKQTNTTSGIIITDIADHFGIFSIIHTKSKTNSKNSNEHKTFRAHNKDNTATFNILLQDSDFQSVFEQNCPDMAYDPHHLYSVHVDT